MNETTAIATTDETPSTLSLQQQQTALAAASANAVWYKPHLALALAAAQAKCLPAEKSSRNAHYGYKYASAESIIVAGKDALRDTGLALVPLEQTLSWVTDTPEGRYELQRKFILLHSSGEWMPLTVNWPVVVEKGRPLDKATAIGVTLSLSYLYRDLLQMPRIDESDNVDADRDEREPEKRQEPTNGQHGGNRVEQEMDVAARALIVQLVKQLDVDVKRFCDFFNCKSIETLNSQDLGRAVELLKQKETAAAEAKAKAKAEQEAAPKTTAEV